MIRGVQVRENVFQKPSKLLKFTTVRIESASAERGISAGAKAVLKDYVGIGLCESVTKG